MMDTQVISGSGTAASGTLTEILTHTLHGKHPWVSLKIKNTDAAAAFADCKLLVNHDSDLAAGDWVPRLSGSDWSDASALTDGERSGADDQGNGNYANDLDPGEFCEVQLFLGAAYAFRIQVSGSGATATVEIKGFAAG